MLKSCLTLGNHVDGSLPGSSVHGISQSRILERVAIRWKRESSQPRYQTQVSGVSCSGRQILDHGITCSGGNRKLMQGLPENTFPEWV